MVVPESNSVLVRIPDYLRGLLLYLNHLHAVDRMGQVNNLRYGVDDSGRTTG